jgi:hypothetical protein
LIEACAGRAIRVAKIIHNFHDLLEESPGRRREKLSQMHVTVVVALYLEYHPGSVAHDHADRLIQTAEIRGAKFGGRQTDMQLVPRRRCVERETRSRASCNVAPGWLPSP